jgi:hypothetical protein
MNDVMIQALIWLATAGMLLLYMKRRRKRKMMP